MTNFRHDSMCLWRDSKRAPSEYVYSASSRPTSVILRYVGLIRWLFNHSPLNAEVQ
jgi:hypothetical protein